MRRRYASRRARAPLSAFAGAESPRQHARPGKQAKPDDASGERAKRALHRRPRTNGVGEAFPQADAATVSNASGATNTAQGRQQSFDIIFSALYSAARHRPSLALAVAAAAREIFSPAPAVWPPQNRAAPGLRLRQPSSSSSSHRTALLPRLLLVFAPFTTGDAL